jgi:hypothetical protein
MSCHVVCWTPLLNVEAAVSTRTSIPYCLSTWQHTPQYSFLYILQSENLISHTMISMFMGGYIVLNCGGSSWVCVILHNQCDYCELVDFLWITHKYMKNSVFYFVCEFIGVLLNQISFWIFQVYDKVVYNWNFVCLWAYVCAHSWNHCPFWASLCPMFRQFALDERCWHVGSLYWQPTTNSLSSKYKLACY